MRKLITTIALLALIDTSVAIAQTVGFAKSSPRSVNELEPTIDTGGADRASPAAC